MSGPKRVSLDELCAVVGATESEIEEVVAEVNRMMPSQVRAQYGEDYELITLHINKTTGERYALLHATIVVREGKLTDRQRFALEHPTDRSDGVLRPPPEKASRKHGKWLSILEVGRQLKGPWMWMASVSRQRGPGRPYKVGDWKKEWFVEADKMLEELLKGVGGEGVGVSEHMRQLGLNPDNLSGYHDWRLLTPGEIAVVGSQKPEGSCRAWILHRHASF